MNARITKNGLISLILANLLILIGKDNILALYAMPLHYLDMLVTFISVFIVFQYVDWINRYLNKQYLLTGNQLRRISLQVIYGLIFPALLAIVLTFLMWEFLWHKNLISDGYFKYEFLPQLLLMIVFNLYFVIVDLFNRLNKNNEKATILAQRGNKKIPLTTEQISFIHLKNGLNYITDTNSEELLLPNNLEYYEKVLPTHDFFRANRQIIVHRKACRTFTSIENGKIQLNLSPSNIEITISQKRAANFRAWIKA